MVQKKKWEWGRIMTLRVEGVEGVRNGYGVCKPGSVALTPLDSLRRKSSKGSLAEGGVINVNSIFRAIND